MTPTLPYFDTGEVAWSKQEIFKKSKDPSRERFVRRLHVYRWPVQFTLEDYLQISNKELNKVARLCGATLIDYTIGLAEAPPDLQQRFEYRHPIYDLPIGIALVADVERIANATRVSPDDAKRISDALKKHALFRSPTEALWNDASPAQFVNGKGSQQAENGLYLVDIDHRIERPILQ